MMNFGSLPVIKNLVSRSKRERRLELTAEMISPPLGDFRHTVHVGRKGEVFGDASFLSKLQERQSHNRWRHFTSNLRQARWVSSGQSNPGSPICPPPAVSPIIKNAVSLPLLTNLSWIDEKNDDIEEDWKTVTQSPPGLHPGFCTLPRHPCTKERFEDTSYEMPKEDWASDDYTDAKEDSISTDPLEFSSSLWHADSMESLVMDFGPSLMSEIMNKISFSDGPTGTLYELDTNEQDLLPPNLHSSTLSTTGNDTQRDPNQSQREMTEPKGLVSWEQVNMHEEMEVEDNQNLNTEEGYTGITKDLWDMDDESEVEILAVITVLLVSSLAEFPVFPHPKLQVSSVLHSEVSSVLHPQVSSVPAPSLLSAFFLPHLSSQCFQ
uniref:CDC42 effector protein 1 n=1 Tax=Leptobrachium leishanense TaxID=445787 RepID=A0A8C5QRD3_9ANUR